MIANIYAAMPLGYDGSLIRVEGDMTHGLPALNIVGMANKTVSESRDRVRSAIRSSGFTFPSEKITINLAPAELHKDGPCLDLPIALAILVISGQLLPKDAENRLFAGELSLNGELRPINGIINIIETAKAAHLDEVLIPYKNLAQASLVSGIKITGFHNLSELFSYLKNQSEPPVPPDVVKNTTPDYNTVNFDQIKGQTLAKRALAIAIAGHHNILLSGPPGTGKTMLAKAALSLLPPLSPAEQISVTKIHSLSGPIQELTTIRPFRSPHHTCSTTALIGGGPKALPGEISLAHLGILFLDELPEYRRDVLESLRQPLEDRQITISRTGKKATYPANFTLVATMNPCPCGYLGDPAHQCTCTTTQIANYQKKLSGPLLDRIDLFVNVDRISNSDLNANTNINEHNVVKNTISEAIQRQNKRYKSTVFYNSDLTSDQINKQIHITESAKQLLNSASDSLSLSARSYFRVIKVAQTIADLSGSSQIDTEHISEALSFRQKS